MPEWHSLGHTALHRLLPPPPIFYILNEKGGAASVIACPNIQEIEKPSLYDFLAVNVDIPRQQQ